MFYFLRALIFGLVTFSGILFSLSYKISLQAAMVLAYFSGNLAFLVGIGAVRCFKQWLYGEKDAEAHKEETGWKRYFQFTLDHKVIGVQYLVTSFVIFTIAVTMASIMRLELARPEMQFLSFEQYHTIMGMHGISMIVVALIAILGGLGNYFVPIMIGTKDMAFPRLNALSYWMLPPAVILLVSSLFFGGFDFGWTAYPPLSVQGPLGKLSFLLAFITVGFSSIFGGVNFMTTILRLRAKGMDFFKLPIFVWSVFSAGIIVLLATSVVASSLILVVFDRAMGTSFFDPSRGGNALLYQHLFWFYSHPAVYIMILPAFGIILEILPVYARKPLFAYKITAFSFIGIVILSFVVWAHHIFTSGMWDLLTIPFMITTELISVPTGVVFLSALGTLWMGQIRLKVPMLFALGFIFNFLIGGLTGIFNADVPSDLHLHDTYFVVAHFHYTLFGGVIFGLFAGIYHWFPKITGRMFNQTLGKIHFWLIFIGFNSTFLPMFWLGARGMRRRVADYPLEFGNVQLWVSLAAILIIIGVIIFLYNMVQSSIKGTMADSNPWQAHSLEWQIPSPPPKENFEQLPEVKTLPYEYGKIST